MSRLWQETLVGELKVKHFFLSLQLFDACPCREKSSFVCQFTEVDVVNSYLCADDEGVYGNESLCDFLIADDVL